ncbi:MAG TPA: 4-oxalocrotonate tautomerase [Xanthobacteraceae bacterium]|nr:4-oxalocrotonate tautomerase [Xanthobacteraceae bacterium]
MPVIRVEMLEGRTREQKREFAETVTREGARILKCPPEAIQIVFLSVPKDDWATAGRLMSEPKD